MGTSAIVVKGVRTLYICAKGRKYFQEGKTLVEITNDLIAKRTAVAEHLGVSVERLDNIGENLVNGLENGTFHSNQIINFRLLDEADQLDLLRSLDAEGSDIFQILRGKGHNNLELLADLTTNQQNRSLLSEVLSELSEDALIQLEKDLAADAGGALKVFFRESPKGVKAWEKMIKHLDLRKNVDFLDNIKDFSDDILAQLDADILNTKYNLKDLFTESPVDVKNIWKELKDNPFLASDFAKETTDSRWLKWKDREFFKIVTKAGKDFEEYVISNVNILKTKILAKYPNINLSDYEIFTQVQMKTGLGDEFFVADIVIVKRKTITVQGIEVDVLDYDNAISIETKLSQNTNLTTPQNHALTKVKSTENTFDIRSISKQSESGNYSLGNSDNLKVNNFLKVWSNGQGGIINDLIIL